MRKPLPHLAPLGGLLCLALAVGPGWPAVAADAGAQVVALKAGTSVDALLQQDQALQPPSTEGTQVAQASGQTSAQDDAQLSAVLERVCPTLDTCRQALGGLLVRLNTTQQQLINAQERIRQLQEFVQLVENARQVVRQNPELAGAGLSGDAAVVVEQLQLQLGLSAAEIQTLTQARDQALAALEKATTEAQAQAQSALSLSQQVQLLQGRLLELGEDVSALGVGQVEAPLVDSSPVAAPPVAAPPVDTSQANNTSDAAAQAQASQAQQAEIAALMKERELLRAEVMRLNIELRDLRSASANSSNVGQPLLGGQPKAMKGQLDRLQAEVERLRGLNQGLEAKNINTSNRVDSLQAKLTEALVRVEELNAERTRLLGQAGSAVGTGADSLELDGLRARLANSQIALEQAQSEIRRLEALAAQQAAQRAGQDGAGVPLDQSQSAALLQERDALQARLANLAEERNLAVQQMQDAQARVQGLEMADAARAQEQSAREALAAQLAALEADLEQERNTVAALRAEKERLEQEIEEGAPAPASDSTDGGSLQALQQELQATNADKAALERQLIKLEAGRQANRNELDRLAAALQQRDQAIADMQAQVAASAQPANPQSAANQATAALLQAQEALAGERAARAQDRADFQRLVNDLQAKNQQLIDTLDRLQALAAQEKEELVAEIVRLTDEAKEVREFIDLQRLQSGDQQDAVARLTQALEDAERQRASQLDLLGRAQSEIEALLTELGQARTAAANNESQKQKAIEDALRLRKLLDYLIQERDALVQEVAELRQAGQRDLRAQEQLASTQAQMRDIEEERDSLRRDLSAKQREVLELTRQLNRRQDFIANQKAVGRNYDMLVEQLNDAEAELILARMQVSSLQQRLQGLGARVGPALEPGLGQVQDQVQDRVQGQGAQPQAAPQGPVPPTPASPVPTSPPPVPADQLEGARIPGVDPAQDERTLRLLEELRRIGRPKAPASGAGG